MLCKPRIKSKELLIFESLNSRMNLEQKYVQHYTNLKKGYEGEVLFDSYIEKLQCNCLILHDLLLEKNNTVFQIDSLMISQDRIYFYEVKNYEGNYFYESGKLFKKPNLEIMDPLIQLKRSESLLRQLIHSLDIHLQIEPFIVFVNPAFTLYQAPDNKSLIFPTQIKNHIHRLNTAPSKIEERHRKLAKRLLSMHISDSPENKLPNYHYDKLQKGLICPNCRAFIETIGKRKYVCTLCNHEDLLDNAVLDSIKEFSILFPDEKITTKIIYDWCRIVPERRIRNILLKHFTKVGHHRWSYYIYK